MQRIFQRKFLVFLLALSGLIYIYSLPGRVPDIDDAWIGEHAYWLAEKGYVKSNLMTGITDQDERLVVHHKLLTLHGALFIKLFGFSVYSLKAVSLVYFLIFLFLFYVYTVRVRKILNNEGWMLAMIMFLVFPWVYKYSYLFRPEIMLMTMGFMSFILLERSLTGSSKARYLDIFLAGVLSGLAFASHLNGAVVIGAGGLLLLFNKDLKGVLAFIPGVIIASAIYLYDLTPDYGYGFWLYQFRESPALDSSTGVPVVLKPFFNLLNEHRRFFHNPKIIIFSVFMITLVSVGFRSFLERYRNITLYAIFLFLLTALLAVHKSRQYILLYFPYLVIMMTVIIQKVINGEYKRASSPWFKSITVILMAVFIAGSSVYNIQLALHKFSIDDNALITQKYIKGDPSKQRILAPMTFIFNEIEKYEKVIGEVSYTERQKFDKSLTGSGVFKAAQREQIDHIIFTPYYRHNLSLDTLPGTDHWFGYKVVFDTPDLLILSKD